MIDKVKEAYRVTRRGTTTTSGMVKVSAKNGVAVITTYGDGIFYKAYAEENGEMETLLPYNLRQIPIDAIVQRDDKVIITSGETSITLPVYSTEDFAELPECGEAIFYADAQVLEAAMKTAQKFTTKTTGALHYINIRSDEDGVFVLATNSLAAICSKVSEAGEPASIAIPPGVVPFLSMLEGMVTVKTDNNVLCFSDADTEIVSGLSGYEYPDVKRMMDNLKLDWKAIVPDDLLETLSKAVTLDVGYMTMSFGSDGFLIVGGEGEIASIRSNPLQTLNEEALKIAINPALLENALSCFEGNRMMRTNKNGHGEAPILITTENENVKAIVMPMHLK